MGVHTFLENRKGIQLENSFDLSLTNLEGGMWHLFLRDLLPLILVSSRLVTPRQTKSI